VLRIVDEPEGAELNQAWRNRSAATNVLSFPAELPENPALRVLGDLVLCAPVVRREARAQGKPQAAHWAHLVIHGTLHLLGYDHTVESEAEVMEALECAVLAGLGFPDPYQTD
jgi:probable rRNA maturation factor